MSEKHKTSALKRWAKVSQSQKQRQSQIMSEKRWANVSKEERLKHIQIMNKARLGKK